MHAVRPVLRDQGDSLIGDDRGIRSRGDASGIRGSAWDDSKLLAKPLEGNPT